MMNAVSVPSRYNYIAAFLTLACNLRCRYCINRFETGSLEQNRLSGEDWVRGLNRLVSRADLPVTLQGGEPSLHPDFYYIINNIKPELHIDLLTNLQFDIDRFMQQVDPRRIKRQAPYASIRVSYHPQSMHLESLVQKVLRMQEAGYSIGIWGVLHPSQEREVTAAREYAKAKGVDFRTKEFLGEFEGKLYGTMKYQGACDKTLEKNVLCRTTELIIGPNGGIYRCHSDLYEQRQQISSFLDPQYQIDDRFRSCSSYGHCNPCDIKVKTDRFQAFGHTSVEVRFS